MATYSQKRVWALSTAIIFVTIVIIVGAYLLLGGNRQEPVQSGLPRMANLPPDTETDAPPPPDYPPDAPVLEQARKALREGIAPPEAVELAKTLPEAPERADAAFLLLEFAAESGNPQAALLVGKYYDPSDETPSGSIRKNPVTAYEWYRAALKGGQEGTPEQLVKLRYWAEAQADKGSEKARALLARWE